MATRTVTIASSNGLHARPAKLFTQAAAASGAEVTIAKVGEESVNAASILGVISLGIDHGDSVVVEVTGGADDEAVATQLADLLTTDHDDA